MAEKMLEISNLSVSYGAIIALTDENLVVNEGEIITLIGGNGAGKTTTLMSVSNLVEKEEGKIFFRGLEITNMAPHKIVRMGICHVPEGRHIFPSLSVDENLGIGAISNIKMTKSEKEDLRNQVYDFFPKLKERRTQNGGSLSGGEQQMLAIGRGLMMNPELMMLDEPSLGLAPIIVDEIFNLIQRIKENGKTILLIEQNAAMALQVADRGYVLENGRIVTAGKGTELLRDPQVKKAYLGI
jgi:branched-chain amino acid transport system ATP-binding protein